MPQNLKNKAPKPTVAIVGIGRWGKNLIREFDKLTKISACCNRGNKQEIEWMKKNYPGIKLTTDYTSLLKDKSINALVIATPIRTHFELARKALEAGKNVFVEKPLTNDVSKAKKLVLLAKTKKRLLFVGHTFVYHEITEKLKKLLANEDAISCYFNWNKLGSFHEDILWNLACHDIAVISYLLGRPTKLSIINSNGFISPSDIISIKGSSGKNKNFFININRVSNIKNKTAVIITKKNCFIWENDELYSLDRSGNIKKIYKTAKTPLELECSNFVESLKQQKNALSNGAFGLAVVETLAKIKQPSR
ncbi:gfo/Idh/MocA family oxidoreductase [Candidatus Parcubacteria bacterium]|nr:MAG: gfo/Idh/MocA family oxidoreductase [Candidatus Parcubacteria bacterium]